MPPEISSQQEFAINRDPGKFTEVAKCSPFLAGAMIEKALAKPRFVCW
jgi:hypothetical protein